MPVAMKMFEGLFSELGISDQGLGPVRGCYSAAVLQCYRQRPPHKRQNATFLHDVKQKPHSIPAASGT